jgi:hypothetical protein|tara:strand:- start:268 stop:456 length:189 start_codon:yes stop_codon:yes gene_type:complete
MNADHQDKKDPRVTPMSTDVFFIRADQRHLRITKETVFIRVPLLCFSRLAKRVASSRTGFAA